MHGFSLSSKTFRHRGFVAADSLRVLLKKKEVLFTCVKRASRFFLRFPSQLHNYMRVYLATGISIGSSLYTADGDERVAENFDLEISKSTPIHRFGRKHTKTCRRKFRESSKFSEKKIVHVLRKKLNHLAVQSK